MNIDPDWTIDDLRADLNRRVAELADLDRRLAEANAVLARKQREATES